MLQSGQGSPEVFSFLFVVPPADHAKHDEEAHDHKNQHHNGHVTNLHTLVPNNRRRATLDPKDAGRKQNERAKHLHSVTHRADKVRAQIRPWMRYHRGS